MSLVEVMTMQRNILFGIVMLLIVYIGFDKAKRMVCEKKINSCNDHLDNNCEKLTRKDFVYLSVIMIIISIVLVSLSMFTNSQAIAYFSFASTITSIILSVLAIIMTLTGEAKNQTSKDILTSSANTIASTTELLKKYAENIDAEGLHKLDEKIVKIDNLLVSAIRKIESVEENSQRAVDLITDGIDSRDIKSNINSELKVSQIDKDKFRGKEEANNV